MIHPFLDRQPRFDDTNYIAPSAELIGDVHLGSGTSVWFNTTIRADVNWIRIGKETNIQDNCCIHVTQKTAPTRIGHRVTVGHGAVLHGCHIDDDVLIGMSAVVLDHARIGRDSIVGAGALVTQRTTIPPRSMVLGSPARVVRELTDDEVASIRIYYRNYLHYSSIYRGIEQPDTNPFYPVEEAPE